MTAARGLPAYEISNHARPGAESRHNLTYWRYGEYVGVGPGAHGRFIENGRRIVTIAEKMPETWANLVEARGHGVTGGEILTRSEEADEFLLMGLRLAEGIDLDPLRGAFRQGVFAGAAVRAAGRRAGRPGRQFAAAGDGVRHDRARRGGGRPGALNSRPAGLEPGNADVEAIGRGRHKAGRSVGDSAAFAPDFDHASGRFGRQADRLARATVALADDGARGAFAIVLAVASGVVGLECILQI